MIKALFFDLDGTLLNSGKKISAQTRNTLEQCLKKGIGLFVATARPPMLDRMLAWDEDTLSLFAGGVYHNGGSVVVGGEKEYVAVGDEVVQEIITRVQSRDGLNMALQLEGEKHALPA